MKWHTTLTGAALAAILFFAASAHAGFTAIKTSLPANEVYTDPDLGSISITAPATDLSSFTIDCTVDSDPTFYVWARVLNNTDAPWDSYTVTIAPTNGYEVSNLTAQNPADFFFPNYLPTPTYDYLHNSVTFGGGTVDVGQLLTVIISFDLNTAGSPQFLTTTSYHAVVGTTPAPEPASLALLTLGAPFLLRRRRH